MKMHKLKTVVCSLAFQHIKETSALTKQEHVYYKCIIECTYKIQWYTICMVAISLLGMIAFVIFTAQKLKLFKDHLFSNVVKVMLFKSDVQYYFPLILCRAIESIHLFKITGISTPDHVKLRPKALWDILKLEWIRFNIT